MKQKHIIAGALGVLIVVGVIAGIVVFHPASAQQSPAPTQQYQQVVSSQTITAVRGQEVSSGGFTAFTPQTPSLYSTYYFLRAAELSGIPITNEKTTLLWVQNLRSHHFNKPMSTTSNKTVVYIRDYYFYTQIYAHLGQSPPNRSGLINAIQKFQMKDGGYCYARKRGGRCVDNATRVAATHYAISALQTVNATPKSERTKDWLTDQWNNTSITNASQLDTARVEMQSLDLLGVSQKSLPKYSKKRSEVKSMRASFYNNLSRKKMNLFEVRDYYYLASHYHLLSKQKKERITKYLNSQQLQDGGFNAFNRGYSESKGTFLATRVLNQTTTKNLNQTILANLIERHTVASGGFSAAYNPHPSLGATFYALSILNHTNITPTHPSRIAKKLTSLAEKVNKNPAHFRIEDLYHLQLMARKLGTQGVTETSVKRRVKPAIASRNVKLSTKYYAVRLAQLEGTKIDTQSVVSYVRSLHNPDGGYGPQNHSTTVETYYSVSLLHTLGESPKNPSAVIAWVKKSRNPSAGYRFRAGNNSAPNPDLTATYMSVKTLQYSGGKPAHIQQLRNWTKTLKAPAGGYSDYPTDSKASSNRRKLKYTLWAIQLRYYLQTIST